MELKWREEEEGDINIIKVFLCIIEYLQVHSKC